jgi:hypothetical protein
VLFKTQAWWCPKALELFWHPGCGGCIQEFADDLVDLYITAHQNIDRIKGQYFNIGGGP